jgi:hypothetical protein
MNDSKQKESTDKPATSRSQAFPDPVTYMRQRHPNLYSDSSTIKSVELTQGLLEYHLETITSRNQEAEFAYFARRLAEKEICPNLRPQTGPTGGGDSKADSETVLVSSDISELWVGSDPRAAQERWAFAFSAKKDWKGKVASDVRNIASTNRNYSRIYFITNQFAPDKSRAESEDSLSKETGIQVTILDRSWIIKAVIENGRAEIAIEALKIDELRSLIERKLGPADLERQQELDELEKAIGDPSHYQGAQYQLIEDSLRAALLARGLGRPRTEIDGLFTRADRLASNPEQPKQRLRVAYNYAWTVIFWFNDYRQLSLLYEVVERYALQSDQMEDVELLQNLWTVLASQVYRGVISESEAKLAARKDALVNTLRRLAADNTRPNSSLQARTGLALMSIQDALSSQDENALNEVWRSLSQIIADADNLGDYPFERFANVIEALGDMHVEDDAFDNLFEVTISSLEKRRGEAAVAGPLKDRGYKKLEANKPYEAISLLGRALERFSRREHRDDLIRCLIALSSAYTSVGLHWAARSCALSAAERCLAYYHEEGKLVRPSLLAVQYLVMAELRLGRLAHVLMGIELESVLAPQIALTEERRKRFDDHRQLTEGMLGIAFLSASVDQLREMDGLPEALESLELFIPKGFLLYALGYRDELRNEGFPKDKWSDEEIDDFMKMALAQPGRLQMPNHPQVDVGGRVTYFTTVLGCQIVLDAPANPYSMSVSEAVLGTIEAFFATSLNERILPYRPKAQIVVQPTEEVAEGLRVVESSHNGETFVLVQHPVEVPAPTMDARSSYRDGLMRLIPTFIAHVAVVDDIPSYLDKIAGEERGFSRALLYSETSLSQGNLFGASPKVLLADWLPPDGARRFPLARTSEWFQGILIQQIPLPDEEEKPKFESGDPRAYFKKKAASQKHSDRKVASQIDIPAWNEAHWRAVFYFLDLRLAPHPVLCLGFENKAAAERIFRGWQRELGAVDKDNKLRVVIIRGIQRANPAAYRVFVTTNIDTQDKSGSIVTMVGRHQTMTPTTTRNLDGFLQIVGQMGRYLLAPAHFISETSPPDMGLEFGILKAELVVKNAWEISVNDLDAGGITKDDDPVIPTGTKDAPIVSLLALFRNPPR